mmetsp:Transcript_14251/g.23732  ORF Transcript_14251/g.23732 Transcript_14251/m.23732 type:complete len:407 (-) Transcript_14251:248-1468(-)|eukprot:CAMPEP_0119314204 /NCGR_PEP_ID=MMETSP1333-20130426/32068_1 /TAXON_ID=418940 /ORGANISM="Scyphosphaera apsteinii, Strain RCC1455" /LENGTH=406 /DNA_ID=CAMNT_0007319271 /DNA_START=126 /DNA_END=1346 /DNA_ORIENTATION=+
MKVLHALTLAAAVLVGYLIGTSPSSVSPPHVPEDGSPMADVPPWPVFRIAVALNDFLRGAAEATTLPKVRIIDLATAKWHSNVIFALTKNDVFDIVHATPLSCKDIATKLELHEHFLCRVMAAGEALGLLVRNGDTFGTTATSSLLLRNVSGSQKSFVEMINNPYQQPAWDALSVGGSLKTGRSGFEVAYNTTFWEYINERPVLEAEFDGAMSSFTTAAAGSIISSYAFPLNGTLCDVGGSEGGTLRLLLEHYPDASGIVFDRPTVVARTSAAFKAAGIAERARGIGGDFLGNALPADLGMCDTFILKHILHDWDDASSTKILKNIAAVAKRGAKLVVAEHVLGVSGPGMERAKAMMDLNMMAANPSGAKERSVAEFAALFAAAGISAPAKLVQMRDILSLVEVEL